MSRLRDTPPAAGRISDIFSAAAVTSLRARPRSVWSDPAILAERFLSHWKVLSDVAKKELPARHRANSSFLYELYLYVFYNLTVSKKS